MTHEGGEIIQAFPIHHKTVSSVFTDKDVVPYNVLRCIADSTVVYTFTDDSTFQENLVIGEDRALGNSVKSITTTAECMIS